MPVFGNLFKMDNLVRNFKLKEGLAAETSGGLLIVIDKNESDNFKRELMEKYGIKSWTIGHVEKGKKETKLENVEFEEVW